MSDPKQWKRYLSIYLSDNLTGELPKFIHHLRSEPSNWWTCTRAWKWKTYQQTKGSIFFWIQSGPSRSGIATWREKLWSWLTGKPTCWIEVGLRNLCKAWDKDWRTCFCNSLNILFSTLRRLDSKKFLTRFLSWLNKITTEPSQKWIDFLLYFLTSHGVGLQDLYSIWVSPLNFTKIERWKKNDEI